MEYCRGPNQRDWGFAGRQSTDGGTLVCLGGLGGRHPLMRVTLPMKFPRGCFMTGLLSAAISTDSRPRHRKNHFRPARMDSGTWRGTFLNGVSTFMTAISDFGRSGDPPGRTASQDVFGRGFAGGIRQQLDWNRWVSVWRCRRDRSGSFGGSLATPQTACYFGNTTPAPNEFTLGER